MPFEPIKPSIVVPTPNNQLPDNNKNDLGFVDVIGDAFHIDNPVVAAFKGLDRNIDPESEFNTTERLQEDGVSPEEFDQFLYVDNEKEYNETTERIDKDLKARQRIGEAGIGGLLASVVAGTTSPSVFIGGGSLITALKAGRSAWKAGTITGSVVASTIFAEEKLLQETQAGRTDEEVMLNTMAGFILAGALGGGAVKLKNAKINDLSNQLKQKMFVDSEIGQLPKTLSEFKEFDESIGAAKVSVEERFREQGLSALSKEQLGVASKNKMWKKILNGYLSVNKKFNPAVRMTTANAKRVRQFYLEVADASIKPQLTKEGLALPESLEGTLKRRYGDYSKEVAEFGSTFSEFKKANKINVVSSKLKGEFQRFREEVGKAFFKQTPHPNPHIAKAVKQWENYYEGIADEMINLKMLPEDIRTKTDGARYLNRAWQKQKIKNNIPEFKKSITPYLRRQMVKIKARLEGEISEVGENRKPTKEALQAQDDLAKNFNDEDLFEQYLRESVSSVTDNLIGANDFGFKPIVAGAKGPLKKRSFNIPDEEIQDWLNTDILFLSDRYTRQIVPEIEIKNRFGETKFDDIVKETNDEYNNLINESPKKSAKLHKERIEVLKDMETTWDLLKGSYRGMGGSPDSKLSKSAKAVLTANYMASLGGVAISSIPDVGMGILRRGFGNFFGKSLTPFISDMVKNFGKMNKAQARAVGQSLEIVNSSRTQSLFSIGDPMSAGSAPFERFLSTAGNKMSNVNLINQWNDVWQRVSYNGINFRIVNNADDFFKKGKLNAREEEWMNFVGLGKNDRIEIRKQLEKHGEIINNNHVPNIDKWTNNKIKNKFIAAIGKETDRTIITKGVTDIPRFGNTLLGKVMFQWQNFNFAFNNKVIISGLQEADGRTLAGLGSLMALGMMTEYVKSLQSGKPLPDSSLKWVDAGLDRSGILGMLSYGNSFAALGGFSYQELIKGEEGRPQQASDFMQTILGPSGRTFVQSSRLLGSLGKSLRGEGFTQKDLHRARTLMPMQNIFYLKDIFDKLEEEIGENLPEDRRSR